MRVEFEYLSDNTWQPCVIHMAPDTNTSELETLIEEHLVEMKIKFDLIKLKDYEESRRRSKNTCRSYGGF
jgi:hypothetical protein